ncbi:MULTISPECIES: sigma-54 dependent transcriptional regulator [unclassified Pseudodesulfovibrio]|uniref:sigma 54-interacting transcriptional regulator n=1 Tax=unclassified Pseudodesulfovibrio TaxID=2661612 RepID=UPI000FEC08B6|nr:MULTISPECIES: sigma-54 dependent transcriptional regulator [unclassified Pseudodesulfovibrio]MCJ2165085.1 sigma-54 dependent transcriptional regulator [Pseudodesulfovibrio sp. S3-i]RWU03448.1 AAA family ATPase [Pseudodesulfovibrio sp. S3]
MSEPKTPNMQTPSPRRKQAPGLIRKLGLRGKLLLALLPSIVLILLITGYASYTVSEEFIDIALKRTVKMHTMAVAHEMEQYLEECRSDLLFFAQGEMDAEALSTMFERRLASGGKPYFELCFLPASGGRPVVLVRQGKTVHEIQEPELEKVQPTPFGELNRVGTLTPGQVVLSDILEVTYPIPTERTSNRFKTSNVIRFYTSTPGDGSTPPGILFLSVDATRFRNILSWHNSKQSPLWAFPRSDELRFSYFLNNDGWILFQSEDYADTDKKLTTYHARDGFSGALGKPGHSAAFRPNDKQALYWNAVAELQKGKTGLQKVPETHAGNSAVSSFYFSYAPVTFRKDAHSAPSVYGGVVFVDRSQLPIVAGYKNLDMMLLVTAGTIILISILIYWFGRILTKPISILAAKVNSQSRMEEMEEIHLPYSGFDITTLQDSINNIIRRVKKQMVEIQAKDEAILNVNRRECAPLDRERETLLEAELNRIPEIIGTGPAISNMKVNILKAAQVEVDVLITGETGTGKQLVAEAIHNHSARSEMPFVSINCGALDENLLLDALFGHVKGAFSEAKEDRNGAFIEANGGTLFLDEIQSASPKVQQSLLRALASRKVKPLGSDRELVVDVRIVAATNEDIPSLIEDKSFREDLYYRLKVVSIATPALREHRENIALLSVYYLKQAEALAGRENLNLSKGALAKLTSYDWPGNVRELVNCITRAAVMAENDIIQQEEIRLENELYAWPAHLAQPQSSTDNTKSAEITAEEPERPVPTRPQEPESALNVRQKEAWTVIRKQGTVTRKDYQDLVGGNLPTRTAIYDLQDFVKRGLLVKQGKGPSTRYEVTAKD